MAKSLGALEMVLLGDKDLGTCSKVTAVADAGRKANHSKALGP